MGNLTGKRDMTLQGLSAFTGEKVTGPPKLPDALRKAQVEQAAESRTMASSDVK